MANKFDVTIKRRCHCAFGEGPFCELAANHPKPCDTPLTDDEILEALSYELAKHQVGMSWKHNQATHKAMQLPFGQGQLSHGSATCLHLTCPSCEGSGINRHTGGACIHNLACNCPRCSLR